MCAESGYSNCAPVLALTLTEMHAAIAVGIRVKWLRASSTRRGSSTA